MLGDGYMCELMDQEACLLEGNKYCVPIFANLQDVEYFQLKLGLGEKHIHFGKILLFIIL